MRRIAAGLLAIAVTLGIAALSQAPYTLTTDERGILRLAWRFRTERRESCRPLTPDEIARTPVHMRRDQVCETVVDAHRLVLVVDGDTVLQTVVEPAGARGDRPLYVYDEIPFEPGTYEVALLFDRLADSTGTAGTEPAPAPRPSFRDTVMIARRQVVLVTYDVNRGEFVTRSRP